MSIEKSLQRRSDYEVTCSWCDAIMRHTDVKESRGMCLKCYARMLQNYTRNCQLPRKASRASER